MKNPVSRTAATYYAEIARTPLVDDPVEEKNFLRRWQEDKDIKARDAIINTHLRFVVKMAHKRTRDPEAVQDYIAAGNIGLLKAADKFQWWRKPYIRFLTYAGWWIYEEMSSQDYTSSTLVHVPAHRQKAQRKQAREYRNTMQEGGPDSVADMDPGLPEGVVVTMDAIKYTANPPEGETESIFSTDRMRTLLRASIARLPTREQTVLNLYFGMKDEPRNLVQIAAMLDVCPENIRQIKVKGMQLLYNDLKEHVGLSVEDTYT